MNENQNLHFDDVNNSNSINNNTNTNNVVYSIIFDYISKGCQNVN